MLKVTHFTKNHSSRQIEEEYMCNLKKKLFSFNYIFSFQKKSLPLHTLIGKIMFNR